jgi:hypothetical protein
MKTTIHLIECDPKAGGAFILSVRVENDGATKMSLPLERLISKAELAAFDLRDQQGGRIEPVEYKLVNPAHEAGERVVSPGESVGFELRGDFVEKLPGVFALVFPRATYRLARDEKYTLSLRWGDFESDSIAVNL